jgi:hypothetical protein
MMNIKVVAFQRTTGQVSVAAHLIRLDIAWRAATNILPNLRRFNPLLRPPNSIGDRPRLFSAILSFLTPLERPRIIVVCPRLLLTGSFRHFWLEVAADAGVYQHNRP